jgi:hypothetical protein
VGTLKHALKDAVRDNWVENECNPLMQKARKVGLLTGNPAVSPASA